MGSFRAIAIVLLAAGALGCAARTARATAAQPRPEVERSAAVEEPRCGSAYRRLCGPGAQAADARSARHKELMRDVERATLAAIASQLGVSDLATRDAWRAHLDAQPAERREELTRLFRKARAAEGARRVAPLEPLVREEHERLRALALEHLRAARRADPRALRRLEQARLVWPDLGDDAALPRPLRIGCGDHLLVDDAWVTKDATRITLCPGFLLVSAAGADGDALRASIAFLLAHELGHVIAGPTAGEDAARAAEVEADAWAAELVAAHLDTLPDRAAREAYLRRTVEPICAPDGDLTHAPGPERVALLVAHAPRVAAALACAEPTTHRRPSGS
jgi:hypothetical protein